MKMVIKVYNAIFLVFLGLVIFKISTSAKESSDNYYLIDEYYCIGPNREVSFYFLTEDSDSFLLYDGPSYYFVSGSTNLAKRTKSVALGKVRHSSLNYYLIQVTLTLTNFLAGNYRLSSLAIEYNDMRLSFQIKNLEAIDCDFEDTSKYIINTTQGHALVINDDIPLAISHNNRRVTVSNNQTYLFTEEQPFWNFVKISYANRTIWISYFNEAMYDELVEYFGYLVSGKWSECRA